MNYSENVINVLSALSYKGIGKAWIFKNLKEDLSDSSIVTLLNNNSRTSFNININDFKKRKEELRYRIDSIQEDIDGIVAIGDEDFPYVRGKVNNSQQPVCLFYRGNIKLLQKSNDNIALIGLLNPDQKTIDDERKVVKELVKRNTCIVSGLAMGCDTVAHIQTLEMKGETVAILPGPLSDVMPAKNKSLSADIVESGGLVISEYYEKHSSRREMIGRYQERDRLQALFSDGIILAASFAKNSKGNDSGARLAMEYATKYKIPRAVIYDQENDKTNPKYDLNRQLMEEQNDILMIDPHRPSEMINKFLNLSGPSNEKRSYQLRLFD